MQEHHKTMIKGMLGVGGSFGAWIVKQLHDLDPYVQSIAAWFGIVVGALSIISISFDIVRKYRHWKHK